MELVGVIGMPVRAAAADAAATLSDVARIMARGGGRRCFVEQMVIVYSTQLAKMSVDEVFDLTAVVFFYFV